MTTIYASCTIGEDVPVWVEADVSRPLPSVSYLCPGAPGEIDVTELIEAGTDITLDFHELGEADQARILDAIEERAREVA